MKNENQKSDDAAVLRERADEVLRRRETLLSNSQAIAHVGSWELDVITNHLIWSDETYRIFGLEPGEFNATYEAFLEFVHPEDRSALDAAYTDSLREGKDTYEIAHRIIRKRTGEVRHVHEKCIHERSADGEIIRSIGIVQDITDRTLAAKELEQSERRYRYIFENNPQPMWIYDLDTLSFVQVNNAAVEHYGYSKEEFLSMTLKDIRPADDAEKIATFIENIDRRLNPSGEWIHVKKNGELINVEIVSHTITFNSRAARYVLINDITARKRAEEALLLQKQQFFQAQKVQSIGTLAGGIAHDFNNILGIILGYATLLNGHRTDSKKYDEYIGVITKTVERGASLVQQILTFARKADVSFQALNVPEFIREMVQMLRETFPKTITFQESYALNLPEILGDRTQIHQALLNLCVNARDAMPAGGSITIAVSVGAGEHIRSRFSEATEESYLCITVTDTGEGMDEATRLRVFDPFFSTKEKGKGTGLGLSVVYGIMHSHHGFVDVESQEGAGTCFSLFLPAARYVERSREQAKPSIAEIPGGTETILVVEDEEFLMNMVCMFLEAKGYRFMIARDGQEAVELYARHHATIDAVLTDIGLPKLNGFDEFKKLKEIDPNVKVVLASGYFEPAMKDELLHCEAKGFIHKPYRPDDVLQTLRRVLDA